MLKLTSQKPFQKLMQWNLNGWLAAVLAGWLFAVPAGQVVAQEEAAPSESQEQLDFDFANGLYQRGMYESAANQYGEFLQKYSESPRRELAMFRQAESLFQHASTVNEQEPVNGKMLLLEAKNKFTEFIEAFPKGDKHLDARLRLGEISYKVGDFQGAVSHLEAVINQTKAPNLLEAALFYAGRSFQRSNDLEKAERRFRQLRDSFPTGAYTAYATFLIGELLEKQGRLQEAAEILQHLWQNQEQYTIPKASTILGDAQLKAAQIFYQMKNYQAASQAYRAYVESHPQGEHTPRARYGAAWAEYQNQNYEEALNIAEALERQALPPELNAGILFLKGTSSYQQELYPDAIRYFREVIADPNAGPYRHRAWYQLAWSYYLSSQIEEAIAEGQNLLQQNLSLEMSANTHFLIGQANAKIDRYQEAIKELRWVTQLNQETEYTKDAQFLLGDLLYRTEDYATAANELRQFYESYPNSPRAEEALRWACNALFSAKAHQKAVQTAETYLNAFPNASARDELLYRKALAHFHLEQKQKALASLDALLAMETSSYHGDALYWKGYIYEQENELAKAKTFYEQVIAEHPSLDKDLSVTLRVALCDYQLNNHQAAYKNLQKVLATPTGQQLSPEVAFWMVFQAQEQNRHEEALAIAERILELFGQEAVRERVLIAKSNALAALERWDQARQNAEQFLQQYPESLFKPEIYWALGQVYENQNQPQKAIEHYETSLAELANMGNPDPAFEAQLYVDRGSLYQRLGQYEKALESFLRVAIVYDHPELTPLAIYRSIECYIKLKDSSEAKTLYAELRERYAGSEWSRRAKEEFGTHFQ